MALLKKNFQTQNQLFCHSQNTKLAFSQKDIGEKKLYPYFSIWLIIPKPTHQKPQQGHAVAILFWSRGLWMSYIIFNQVSTAITLMKVKELIKKNCVVKPETNFFISIRPFKFNIILHRPVGRISKLEGPALQKLGGPKHTFCTILAKSWGGPGPLFHPLPTGLYI